MSEISDASDPYCSDASQKVDCADTADALIEARTRSVEVYMMLRAWWKADVHLIRQ